MKGVCFLILTTGALMAADGPSKDDPPKGDLDKLGGTWLTVSLVNNGKTLVDEKTPPKAGPTTKLVYDGKNCLIKVADKTAATGLFKTDPTKKPQQTTILDHPGMNNDNPTPATHQLPGNPTQ